MKSVSGMNIVLRNLSDGLCMRLGLQNHHYELPKDSSNVWTASMFPCSQCSFVLGSFSVFKVVKLSMSWFSFLTRTGVSHDELNSKNDKYRSSCNSGLLDVVLPHDSKIGAFKDSVSLKSTWSRYSAHFLSGWLMNGYMCSSDKTPLLPIQQGNENCWGQNYW